MHAQEMEEIQGKIELAVLDKCEAETPKIVKDQDLVANSHLQESQYLS